MQIFCEVFSFNFSSHMTALTKWLGGEINSFSELLANHGFRPRKCHSIGLSAAITMGFLHLTPVGGFVRRFPQKAYRPGGLEMDFTTSGHTGIQAHRHTLSILLNGSCPSALHGATLEEPGRNQAHSSSLGVCLFFRTFGVPTGVCASWVSALLRHEADEK